MYRRYLTSQWFNLRWFDLRFFSLTVVGKQHTPSRNCTFALNFELFQAADMWGGAPSRSWAVWLPVTHVITGLKDQAQCSPKCSGHKQRLCVLSQSDVT